MRWFRASEDSSKNYNSGIFISTEETCVYHQCGRVKAFQYLLSPFLFCLENKAMAIWSFSVALNRTAMRNAQHYKMHAQSDSFWFCVTIADGAVVVA